jgi:hypothetical protein
MSLAQDASGMIHVHPITHVPDAAKGK